MVWLTEPTQRMERNNAPASTVLRTIGLAANNWQPPPFSAKNRTQAGTVWNAIDRNCRSEGNTSSDALSQQGTPSLDDEKELPWWFREKRFSPPQLGKQKGRSHYPKARIYFSQRTYLPVIFHSTNFQRWCQRFGSWGGESSTTLLLESQVFWGLDQSIHFKNHHVDRENIRPDAATIGFPCMRDHCKV